MKKIIYLFITILIIVGVYNSNLALPYGVSVAYEAHNVPNESVTFLYDKTFLDSDGNRQTSQQIFDEVFTMIDQAEEYILIDMFLFNPWQGKNREETRMISKELTEKLLAKKEDNPGITIILISDNINNVYGGAPSKQFESLKNAGIHLVVTDLRKLRDSNPLYSSLWRTVFQWFGNSDQGGIVMHPFDYNSENITIRSYLSLLNFKANHRKLIVTDFVYNGKQKMATLVTSANPHDGSSAHGNVALRINDHIWRDVIKSEEAVGKFSNKILPKHTGEISDSSGNVSVQLLTESKIKDRLLELLDATIDGDIIDMAMFYFSDRDIMRSIISATQRGVDVRLVLDANKDAFGHEKNGVPNRPVANEILQKAKKENIEIRWCATNGEQCHAKLLIISNGDKIHLNVGSANLTRRNLDDYNLETNIIVSGNSDVTAISDAQRYFEKIWTNEDNKIYTTEYETYADDSKFKWILYIIAEKTGLSTF